ncbi:MAG: DUF4167 domain-containing protein [Alphaproteobacteria bacterium]|nr:MAG: DUF4167 domain-containing protein [Alphaproteobacteria bacterium]
MAGWSSGARRAAPAWGGSNSSRRPEDPEPAGTGHEIIGKKRQDSMSRPQNARRAQRRSQRAQNGRQDRGGVDPQLRNHARQMVDKYRNLAREALAAGDHVQAESYFQHADHYQRILNELQEAQRARQAEARARQQARQQQDRQGRAAQQQEQPAASSSDRNGQDSATGAPETADPAAMKASQEPDSAAKEGTSSEEAAEQSVNGAPEPAEGKAATQTRSSSRKRTARTGKAGNGGASQASNEGKAAGTSRRRKSRSAESQPAETGQSVSLPAQEDSAQDAGARPAAGE